MTVSNYLANKILDKLLRGVDFTTAPVWAAIHDIDPGITGAGEVFGNAYQRQVVSQVDWNAAAARLSDTITALQWLNMPSAAVNYIGLWDSPSNGNFLIAAPVSTPVVLGYDDTYQINAGQLIVNYL